MLTSVSTFLPVSANVEPTLAWVPVPRGGDNTRMSLRTSLGDIRRRMLCAFYRRTVPLCGCGPVVSFTFDDFPRTALSVGGTILEKFGTRGTYYVTLGLMNSCNELGQLFRGDDLCSLLERGHDLGTHTFHHSSCRSLSLSAFVQDVKRGKNAVADLVGHDPTNFAYPYGDVSLRVKKNVGPMLKSCRGIVPGVNGPEVDLNLLRANKLYGDIDRLGLAEGLIEENVKRKTWLIFYTHDISPHPSPYGCTPALFESVVSNAARSGSRLLTVEETLTQVGDALALSKESADVCLPT
jgi:peptidoglycan/xylan/chitin deacetylase (PgdA/CDA1 family)